MTARQNIERALLATFGIRIDNAPVDTFGLKYWHFSGAYKDIAKALLSNRDNDLELTYKAIKQSGEMTSLIEDALLDIMALSPLVPSGARRYAEDLIRENEKDAIINACLNARELILEQDDLEAARAKLKRAMAYSEGGNALYSAFNDLEAARQEAHETIPCLPTNIDFLDGAFNGGGIKMGQLVLIAGEPDAGKTSLAIQIAIESRVKSLFFTLEFGVERFLDDRKELGNADKCGHIYLSGVKYLTKIERAIRQAAEDGIKFVFIDSQMSVINQIKGENKEREETEKFKVLQQLAIELKIVIFFISQTSKQDARSRIITPMFSKAGAHFAHIYLSIQLAGKHDAFSTRFKRKINFEKNKQGKNAPIEVFFNPRTLFFESIEARKPQIDYSLIDSNSRLMGVL